MKGICGDDIDGDAGVVVPVVVVMEIVTVKRIICDVTVLKIKLWW